MYANDTSTERQSRLEFSCTLAQTFLGDNDTYMEDICTMPNGTGVEAADRGSPSHTSTTVSAKEGKCDSEDMFVVESPTGKCILKFVFVFIYMFFQFLI